MHELEILNQYIIQNDEIYVYGAGLVGQLVQDYIDDFSNEKFKGYIVTNKKPNDNAQIYEPNEIAGKNNIGIIVAMKEIPYSVKQITFELTDRNILFMNLRLKGELELYRKEKLIAEYNLGAANGKLFFNNLYDPSSVILEKDKWKFRVYCLLNMSQMEVVKKYCNIEQLEREYGRTLCNKNTYRIVKPVPEKVSFRSYIVTSELDNMNVDSVNDQFHSVIQVGTDMSKILKNCIHDNSGDNISYKNREYCECTGLYWIWKNVHDVEYIGLEHYRRRLNIDEEIIKLVGYKLVDVVVSYPQFAIKRNIEFINNGLVLSSDWKEMKRILIEYDSDYKRIVDEYEQGFFYFSCNIAVMKRNIFEEYCEFAFYIANKLEESYANKCIYRKGDRYMGFIFEHLLSLFLKKNSERLRIYCTDLYWVN